MKILMVVHGFPPECSGGTESYLLKLTKELRGRRHDVRVLTGSHEGRPEVTVVPFEHDGVPAFRLHRSGLFVDNWDKSWAPEIEPAIDGILKSFRPDIVHVHHWIRLSRHLVEIFHDRGIPCVATLHDLWTTCPIAFRVRDGAICTRDAGAASCHDCAPHATEASDAENAEALDLFAADTANDVSLARRVIVPTNAHRHTVARRLPGIDGRLRVIPHGWISGVGRTPDRKRPGADVLRLGHWGHLSKLKGVDILLDALSMLGDATRAKVHLDLFGEAVYPNERPEIEARVAKLPVTWHRGPFKPETLMEVPMDLAVIPSRCSESHSFVLDEAFLLGLPAIVPNVGALAERVGGAGATFTHGDPANLAGIITDAAEGRLDLDAWRKSIPRPRAFSDHALAIESLYRETVGMASPLATTPASLRSRRTSFLSRKVETRNATLDHMRGSLANAKSDLERAGAVMAEMEHYHKEKDKVIDWLKSQTAELDQLRQERSTTKAQYENAVAALEDTTHQLRLELANTRRDHSETVHQLESLLGDYKIENQAYMQRLASKDRLLDDVAKALDAQTRDKEELGKNLLLALATNATLERALGELRNFTSFDRSEIDALDASQSDRPPAAIAAHVAIVGELEARVHAMTQRTLRLESELTQRTQHLEEAIRTVGIAADHRAKLQGAMDDLDAAHRQLGADFTALKRESEIAIEEHRAELARRSELTMEMGRALRTLESRLDGLARMRAEEATNRATTNDTIVASRSEGSLLSRLLGGKSKAPATPDVPDRLKVLFILHQFLPKHVAGTEVYTANLTRALRERGHEAVVLCCEAHHDKSPFTRLRREMEGMTIHEVVQNYTWESFEATYNCPPMEGILESVLDEERPDVVHVQHLHYFSAGFLKIIKDRGIPIVYHLHDYMLLCPRDGQMRRADGEICDKPIPEKCAECIAHHKLDNAVIPFSLRPYHPGLAPLSPEGREAAMRAEVGIDPFDTGATLPIPMYAQAIMRRLDAWKDAAKHVDLFVSPSRFLRDMFVKEGMAAPEKIVFSDNGQDTSRFSDIGHADSDGRLRIGFIGSIAEHKGIHVLIDAMNGLPHDLPAECVIWGDGRAFIEYTESLKARITHPRTLLKGPFDPHAVAAVLSTVDVLVVPSLWYENSPLTVHEAQMAGVPVIASDIGGLAEYVVEGRNGMRFHTGDADDLRKKLLWLLEDTHRVRGFDFATIPIKDIAQDAAETEARYKDLLRNRPMRV